MRTAIGQFARYFVTAGIAAVVDVGGFALLYRAGLPIAVAAVLSFGLAAIVNYLLTARLVFGSRRSSRQFALFLGFATVGLLINVGLTLIFVERAGFLPEAAKICAIGIAFFANFSMNKFIVFRDRRT